jgi:DNA-binding response OmpR family regulator
VITETQLPLFDGYVLCEVLRRDSLTRAVPILVVTAEKRATELDRARDAGADGVLIKPVSPDALLNEIQRLLRRPAKPSEQSGTRRDTAPRLAERRPKSLTKAHLRFETITLPARPAELICPSCDRPLLYECSHVAGVSTGHAEQWDDYTCTATCGIFVYRHRTRKLSRIG